MLKYSDIVAAQAVLKGVIKETPLQTSKTFSTLGDCQAFLKLENLQSTGSFKVRGAYNKIFRLSEEEKKRPVVAASAGNHAQGVAYSSQELGLKSTIVMPAFTPPLKVLATRSYGAEVILTGNNFDEAYATSQQYCKENNATYIHPFDDPMIIAGQGTVGIELFHQISDVDIVIVPIGGGGLIGGVALALKTLNPNIKVIGVEAEGAASMFASTKENRVVGIPHVDTIADGIAVKTPGEITFELTQKYVDDIVTVNDAEIANATYLLLQRAKTLAEPSGAAAVAALIYKKYNFTGKKVVPIISGGNINMTLLEQIVEQGMMDEGLRKTIRIIMPDKPGELNKITTLFNNLKISIQDIEHVRSINSVPIGKVMVIITVNLKDKEQMPEIEEGIHSHGFTVKVLG